MRARLSAPFGCVEVEESGGKVVSVSLNPHEGSEEVPEEFPGHVLVAMRAYLDGNAPRPVTPVELEGTEFQQSVWRALADIPPGEPVTYGDLASALGKPGAARAVGQALRNNPMPLIFPCHRVVAQDGLGGFGGCSNQEDPADEGQLGIKAWLLDHEVRMRRR